MDHGHCCYGPFHNCSLFPHNFLLNMCLLNIDNDTEETKNCFRFPNARFFCLLFQFFNSLWGKHGTVYNAYLFWCHFYILSKVKQCNIFCFTLSRNIHKQIILHYIYTTDVAFNTKAESG